MFLRPLTPLQRMDDFEKAILCSYDPSIGGALKESAIAFCESVRTSPDAWKFCVEKLFNSNVVQVKFFCLQILQDLILHRHATFLVMWCLTVTADIQLFPKQIGQP